eukprot:TRINITY_DN8485_c0_g3_i1.p3 TRINITY_DN8485_c0_g3~~TRINITY_DN8485_c0_g3_i1.p3  ORF type:complete len:337 (-),score=64.82 TRINITY_DN8485_c0_g3_i1:648-1658(-)
MNFANSTQHKQFTFTGEQLAQKRKENNDRAIAEAKRILQQENQTIQFLTVEEEVTLVRFYESRMQDFCRRLRIPRRVCSVAMIFFKRYYIRYSVMEKDPLNVMMTAIYLACKTMDNYISAEELCKLINRPITLVLSYEISLLESMGFCMFVFTPEDAAIEGLIMEFQNWQKTEKCAGTSLAKVTAEQLHTKVKQSTYASAECLMRSDAILIFSHSKLALAAFRSGLQRLKLDDKSTNLDPFLRHIAQENEDVLNVLKKQLQELDILGQKGATVVKQEDVKEVDRRMKQVLQVFMKEEKEQKQKSKAAEKKRKAGEAEQPESQKKLKAIQEESQGQE